MSDTSLAFASAWELAAMIRRKTVSPVEVAEHFLARIEDADPRLHAFLTVPAQRLLDGAAKAERAVMAGARLGPLHGVPVAVKDLEYTRGIRTTGGSLAYADFVPDEDAAMVARLGQAGALVLGKTNTPEFGFHSETRNRLGEDCRNPWDASRTSGGSSGGSAVAMATGMAPLATGTDGAGSIRIPAAFCGVYGLKPSHGLVSRHGGFLGIPLFSTSGPLTRTVRDAALWLTVAAGHDPRDPATMRGDPPDFLDALGESIEGLRVAWSADLGILEVTPEVRRLTESAARDFESLGARVEEASPEIEHDYFLRSEPIRNCDKFAAFGDLLDTHAGALTSYVRGILELGAGVSGLEYSRCLRYLEALSARCAAFFERYDLLLTPTSPFPAFPPRHPPPQKIGSRDLPADASTILLTLAWNLTGQPAASVPCGFTAEGLPVGLQIVAARWNDSAVLRASAAFEKLRPWNDARPGTAGEQDAR